MYNTFLYNLLKSPLINSKSSKNGRLSANEVSKLKSILMKSMLMAAAFALLSLIIFFILKATTLNQKSIIIFTAFSALVCIFTTIILIKTKGRHIYLGYIYIFFSACIFAGLVFINIYTDFVTVKFILNTYIVLIVTIYLTAARIIKYDNKNNQLFSSAVVTFLVSLCIYAAVLIIMYKISILDMIYTGNMTAYILSDIIIIFMSSLVYVINMELIVKNITYNISSKKQIFYAFSLVFLLLWFIIVLLKIIINKKGVK